MARDPRLSPPMDPAAPHPRPHRADRRLRLPRPAPGRRPHRPRRTRLRHHAHPRPRPRNSSALGVPPAAGVGHAAPDHGRPAPGRRGTVARRFFLLRPDARTRTPPPRDVLLDGMAHILAELRHAPHVRKGVMTSSTGVYAQTGGQTVDADTPAKPWSMSRGRLLVEAEERWLAAFPGSRAKTAPSTSRASPASYGPGRVVGLSGGTRRGTADRRPRRHAQPAARRGCCRVACWRLPRRRAPGGSSWGVTTSRCRGSSITGELAHRLGVASPAVLDDQTAAATLGLSLDRLRRTSSKRCDNTLTRRRTGWAPRFGDFRAGLDAGTACRPDGRDTLN